MELELDLDHPIHYGLAAEWSYSHKADVAI
jgi:hypothetical protein